MPHASRILVAVLAAGIAACSSATQPAAPLVSARGTAANHERATTGGGTFTASSSGTGIFADCTTSENGHFKFVGDGRASYLHRVNESGKLKGARFGAHCVWSGNTTLTRRHQVHDSVTFSLGLNGSRYANPCDNAVGYVVKRGTGKFAHASGYGTVTFFCSGNGYADTWSGTLNF